jgi:hypothetical protein
MLSFTKYFLPLLFLWHLAATNVFDSDSERELHKDLPKRQLPSLTAITVRSDIQKREESFVPKQRCEHHYGDRMLLCVE